MPNVEHKHHKNIPGKFYCTDKNDEKQTGCIGCDLCYTSAPEFFAQDDDGFAYVAKQPITPEEIEVCMEQMAKCPVNSIGYDDSDG